jgi:hypothetical protein
MPTILVNIVHQFKLGDAASGFNRVSIMLTERAMER